MTGGWYSVQSKSHKMSLDCKILEIAVIHCTVDSYNWNPLADKQLTS